MNPLRIVAEMHGPVVGVGDPIHLDALVALGFYRRLSPQARDALPDNRVAVVDFDLPLARWTCEGELPGDCPEDLCVAGSVRIDGATGARLGTYWGWCASRELADWAIAGVRHTRKRQPVGEAVRYTRDATYPVAGPLKAKNIAHPTRYATTIIWYAVGDLEAVRACLDEVTHVGKLGGHGAGRVGRWHVAPCAEDWSVVRPDGDLARDMPAGYGGRQDWPEWGGIRPPYWHSQRQTRINRSPGGAPC